MKGRARSVFDGTALARSSVRREASLNEQHFNYITVTKQDGVARLVFNRPPLNVLNIEMLREINSALAQIASDASVKALVLTGEGKAFSAGVDVGEHLPELAEEMLSTFHRTVDLLLSVEAPVVAGVNGAALGGGCEIALCCDLVIAAERAKMGQPEIRLGVLAPAASVLLPRLCGVRKAMELLLLGTPIDAREAHRIGLVNTVVADDQFPAQLELVVQDLAKLSSAALRLTKGAVRQGLDKSVSEGFAIADAICLDGLLHTHDAQEGLRAFLEKRPPEWKAR